jgi:transcription antitermination factor NusG
MKRGDCVRICAGWMSGQIGYVERIDDGRALVMVHGGAFPFPRLERVEVGHLRRVDLQRERDRAARESVGEAPF